MDEALDFLNTRIREEHGNRVTPDSLWKDAEVDSFGTTMVFLDLDEKYGGFNRDWMGSTDFTKLTIADILKRITDAGQILPLPPTQ